MGPAYAILCRGPGACSGFEEDHYRVAAILAMPGADGGVPGGNTLLESPPITGAWNDARVQFGRTRWLDLNVGNPAECE